ncbi:hypothetical protein BH11VER1_BH11VER1_29900 [soil metagenome]
MMLVTSNLMVHSFAAEAVIANDANILGQAGNHVVRMQDVEATLAGLSPQEREAAIKDPTLLNQMVRSMLVQNLVHEEALSKKWDEQPGNVAYLARMRESAITQSYLQSICSPPPTYPNEAELLSAYEAGKPALLVPRSYRLAQIFIAEKKDASNSKATPSRKKIEDLRKLLQNPDADFAALAATWSEETESSAKGGEIGWLTEAQIQPEIRTQLPKLKLNAVTEPLHLEDGWHFLKVLDIREANTPTLEQVRTRLVQQLRADRTRQNTMEYLAKLVREQPPAINELALSKILSRVNP